MSFLTNPLVSFVLGAAAGFATGYLVRRNNPHDPTVPKAK